MRTEACSPTLFPTRCYCSGIALRSGGLLWRKTHMAGHKWAHHWLDRIPTHVRSFGMVRPIMGAAPRGGGHFVPTWCLTSGVARSVRYRPFCNLCSSCRGAGLPPRHAGCPAHHSVCGDRRPLWGGKHGAVASVAETMCCGLLPHRCAAASP